MQSSSGLSIRAANIEFSVIIALTKIIGLSILMVRLINLERSELT